MNDDCIRSLPGDGVEASERRIEWRATGDAELPYEADVDGVRWTVRVNDFPAEPLYTLIVGGAEARDINTWPRAWIRPA
jgi:hypothetical protein